MKKITLLILLLLALNFSYGQTKIAELTFESPGGYSTSTAEYIDIINSVNHDYFTRTDGSSFTFENYSNIQGSYFFAAQDIDNNSAIALPVSLLIDDINISGYSSLEFRVHLAEDDSADGNEDYDASNYVHFDYDIDNSGSSSPLLWIEGSGGFNTAPFIDTNYDGTGDGTEITDTFSQFTQSIAVTGSLLDIEIVFHLDAGDEDIAIDNIEIWGVLTSCPTTVTWDGTSWDNPPLPSTNAVIDGDYSGGSFSACSLLINATRTLTVSNGNFVEIENDVIVNGNLNVQSQGNFVQRDDAGTFVVNAGGSSTVNKQTAPKADWFYYTYWSSPVVGETIGNVFANVDGDRRFWFNAVNFEDTNGDDIDDNGDDWQYALGGDTMNPGIGYAATESRFFIPGIGAANFEGVFNTGDVTVAISNNPANVIASWNFIGNPYASAIDFDAFHTANSTVVDGAAYFWSQSLPPNDGNNGNEEINFSKNDYATYTVGSGGAAGPSGVTPNQYIPSGQGFFINGIADGSVTFTNAMRMADATSNLLFFKGSKKSKANNVANRLWINLTTNSGVFSQILLAYVEGASNGNDGFSYDAPKIVSPDYAAILYSSMDSDNKKYVIQGKNIDSINEDEIINLGFSSTIESDTEYKLSISQFEGDFLSNNNVYIKDNLLNTVHNLSDSDYTFTSEVGEFNDRFEIRFNSNILSTEDLDVNSNTLKIVELANDNVRFTASKAIKTVKIFDVLGRQLYQFEGRNTSETYKLSNLNASVFIAKVELSNGLILTKKAVKK